MGGTRKIEARRHTRARIRERYDLDMTDMEYEWMISEAVGNPDSLVIHRDDGSSLHRVPHRGQDVVVLLDHSGTLILTAYPVDASLVSMWSDPEL